MSASTVPRYASPPEMAQLNLGCSRRRSVCAVNAGGGDLTGSRGIGYGTRIPKLGATAPYLTLHMAEAHPAGWRFEPAAAGDAPAPDRVKWRFKLGPYAGGEVRTFVPPYAETFGVHRPITIEARLYLNGEYQTAIKENTIIQGSPDDPDLATAVASLTQNLLSPSEAYRSINSGQTKASHRRSTSRASARFANT